MHTDPMQPTAVARLAGAIDHDVTCPLCEYNLRGLTEPRCPECGFRFTWDEVLDPEKRFLSGFFEAGRAPRVRSFLVTIRIAQRPRQFWRVLSPVQPLVRRRLAIYATVILTTTIFLMSAVVSGTGVWIARRIVNGAWPGQFARRMATYGWNDPVRLAADGRNQRISVAAARGGIRAVLVMPEFWRMWPRALPRWIAVAALCAILWPGLTLLALLVFKASMRRARIRFGHVARAVVYCADVIIWAVPLFGLLTLTDWVLQGQRRPWYAPDLYWFSAADHPLGPVIGTAISSPTILMLLLGLLLGIYRMCIAYRLYLRFDHPVLTVLASQAIALLIVVNIVALSVWL